MMVILQKKFHRLASTLGYFYIFLFHNNLNGLSHPHAKLYCNRNI